MKTTTTICEVVERAQAYLNAMREDATMRIGFGINDDGYVETVVWQFLDHADCEFDDSAQEAFYDFIMEKELHLIAVNDPMFWHNKKTGFILMNLHNVQVDAIYNAIRQEPHFVVIDGKVVKSREGSV